MWPHGWQPTRLPSPWDSPGKNTGVGCHFLLQCMKVKSVSEVVQSCPTLGDPMDCSPPGSSVHGIFQTGVLEWDAIAFLLHPASMLIFDLVLVGPPLLPKAGSSKIYQVDNTSLKHLLLHVSSPFLSMAHLVSSHLSFIFISDLRNSWSIHWDFHFTQVENYPINEVLLVGCHKSARKWRS